MRVRFLHARLVRDLLKLCLLRAEPKPTTGHLKVWLSLIKIGGKHLIVSSIEHHAVLESAHWLEQQGFEVTYLPVTSGGTVSTAALESALRADTVLVSIMAANNEVGTLEPIKELAACAHKQGVLFHTDAVQAYGRIPVSYTHLTLPTTERV